ncbi:MAG: hypothetical protein GX409_05745 [candidate division Zixibacteria bacterium]|nr:hypothetical protein [candidate division Zixibacteria bacterium]
MWKGKRYLGTHKPLIGKSLYDKVQEVFDQANHPLETKRGFPFAGLIKCGKCGCSMTPEIKKGRYIYYHCTQHKGKCDNDYVRQEVLVNLFADVVKRIQIDDQMVEYIKVALLESQGDKIKFHEDSVNSLQKRYAHLRQLLDKAYEDKLTGQISEDFWQRKSQEWDSEMLSIQHEIKAHQNANTSYFQTGIQILELANKAYDLYLHQTAQEQRKLLNMILSNCTFFHGTLCPTYKKPFDILAKGLQNQTKRGRRDSNSRPSA